MLRVHPALYEVGVVHTDVPRSPLLLAVVRRLEPPWLLRSSLDCPSFSPCRLLMIRVAPLLLGLSETSEPNFLHSA